MKLSLTQSSFGTGPLLWAPLSEIYGRRVAILVPFFIGAIFTFAAGAATNIQTLMIARFFSGFFGAAPVTNGGGVLADLFAPEQRGGAMAGYSLVTIGGPLLAPLVGAATSEQSALGWRWVFYVRDLARYEVV